MHVEGVIKQDWRYNCRLITSELRDALVGRHGVSLQMRFEAMIERVSRWNSTPRASELKDTLGGRDPASLKID